MDVRRAAIVPDERRAFDPPAIPDLVAADVAVAVERQAAGVQAALLCQECLGLLAIALAIRVEQLFEDLGDQILLIARHAGDRNARKLSAGALEGNARLARQLVHQRGGALFLVEHFVHAVGGQRLVPEDVARVIGLLVEASRRVTVEDRTAKGHVLGAVAVATDRHVPAGHHELERAARRAKHGDVLRLAVAAGVVFQLLVDPLVPVGLNDVLEDVPDHRLLVFGVIVAADRRFGNMPIGGDPRA